MDKIIHYTSLENLEKIKSTDFLLPKSDPNIKSLELSERIQNIVQHNSYLVGIPQPLEEGWVEYGLMDYLLKHTSGEVVLGVPLFGNANSFVRDHSFLSPKNFIDQYGEDLAKKVYSGKIGPKDPRIINSVNLYLESTISLEDYGGNYIVPEIWTPQKTPVDNLEIVVS
tara:strand:- start:165 stop:671 length:507 start_codon:yes stop_codon:yes gene_type:complete